MLSCSDLAARISFPNTLIAAANPVAAGVLTVGGSPVAAHCQVTGKMYQRVSPVDGKSYAIGFELRLPNTWSGRFFYQANGGIDGSVATALGAVNGGAGLTNALDMGFAVISSDAGHAASQGPFFGIDPQARLDYGYQAVAKLTPMAKAAIQTAYGKGPDRSYFGGCSNGGRHTMVAAARHGDQYDGFLVGDLGYTTASCSHYQHRRSKAIRRAGDESMDISTGFTTAERQLVSKAVLDKCDALNGSVDGLVQDTKACQTSFDLNRDVPTCTGTRDGTCVSAAQKTSMAQLFAGAKTETNAKIYTSFPFDAGLGAAGWAVWKFSNSLNLDSGAVGLIWEVPPENPTTFNGPNFTLTGNLDLILAKVHATNATYTESALSFMTPPHPTDLSVMKNRGAKIMMYHGTSDPIFSSNDTVAFYDALAASNGGNASNFTRLYLVPGMNHCSGGPATDQFDMLTPIVNWVEKGTAPNSVIASARGPGNVAAVNADVPANWAPSRTRPLCVYPKVARYKGGESIELADNFMCQ